MLNNNLTLMPLNFNIITQGTSGLGVLLANAQSNGTVIWKINPLPSQNTFLIDQNETIVINCNLPNNETNTFLLKNGALLRLVKGGRYYKDKSNNFVINGTKQMDSGLYECYNYVNNFEKLYANATLVVLGLTSLNCNQFYTTLP
jgi:hypothetical protein